MKKNVVLPSIFGVVIAVLVGVIAVIALPYLKVFFSPVEETALPDPPPPEPAPVAEEEMPPPRLARIPQRKGIPIPDSKKPEPEPEKPGPEKPDEDAAKRAEVEAKVEELYPLPNILPLETIVDRWNNVPPRAFPKGVTVDRAIEFKLMHEGQVIGGRKLPEGAHVVPLELRGTVLVVAPDAGSSMRAEIGADETNFKELIRERYDSFVERRTSEVMASRAAELDRIMKAEAYEAALADYNDGSDPRFDPMKESLRNAEAGTFELENTTEWRWLGEETIDGVEYEVGLAVFETESAFGVARTEIKALMRDGQVEKWVDPTTGEPI